MSKIPGPGGDEDKPDSVPDPKAGEASHRGIRFFEIGDLPELPRSTIKLPKFIFYTLPVRPVGITLSSIQTPAIVVAGRTASQVRAEALSAARATVDDEQRVCALVGLIRYLPDDQAIAVLDEAAALARMSGRSQADRFPLLASLDLSGADPDRWKLLRPYSEEARGQLVDRLASRLARAIYLPREDRDQLNDEVLVAASNLETFDLRLKALRRGILAVARSFAEDEYPDALMAVFSLHRISDKVQPDSHSLPSPGESGALPHQRRSFTRRQWDAVYPLDAQNRPNLQEARLLARAIESTASRAYALIDLARYFSHEREAVLGEAIDATRLIAEPEARCRGLADLAALLPSSEKAPVADEALGAATACVGAAARAIALAYVAPVVDEGRRSAVLREVVEEAKAIEDEPLRVRTLAEITPRLPEAERAGVVTLALAAAANIADHQERSLALARLSCLLE